MLILSRKLSESIVIDGRIVVTVMRVHGDVVKLGIEAAPDVPIHRQEIYEEIQSSNLEALASGRARSAAVPRLLPTKPAPTALNPNPTPFP